MGPERKINRNYKHKVGVTYFSGQAVFEVR